MSAGIVMGSLKREFHLQEVYNNDVVFVKQIMCCRETIERSTRVFDAMTQNPMSNTRATVDRGI